MKKIVEECTAVFGANPNKKYTFIIHNVVNGQGGLEHVNSTVLVSIDGTILETIIFVFLA